MNRSAKALIVGVADAPDMAPLPECLWNTEQLTKVLSTHHDGTPNFHCRTYTSADKDRPVTTSFLMQKIEDLFATSVNTALFYFTGHGFSSAIGGSLVTQDYEDYNPGVSFGLLLSHAERALSERRIGEVIIILDCCYSGDVGDISLLGKDKAFLPKGLTIMTSSGDGEMSFTRGDKQGTVFSHHLINGLKGNAGDLLGNITAVGVFNYISRLLDAGWMQSPYLKTYSTNITPLRFASPKISKSELRKILDLFPNGSSRPLDPSYEPTDPSHIDEHVKIFGVLQKLNRMGLVTPDDEDHMYYAAMNSRSCSLTSEGEFYWMLASKGRL